MARPKIVIKPKVFTKYPCARYPRAGGDPVTVRNAEEEAALGDGYADTPAAFAPGYKRLTEDPPEGTVVTQYVKPSKPPIPYPAMRYPRDGGEPVTVQTPDADLALGPDWQDHPWTKAEREAPPVDETALSPAPPLPAGESADTGAEPDGLWGVTVAQAKEVLEEMRDPVELAELAARERRNPNGPRMGVLTAIVARQKTLAAAPMA